MSDSEAAPGDSVNTVSVPGNRVPTSRVRAS